MVKRADLIRKLSGGDRRSIGGSEEVVSEVLADGRLFAPLFECLLNHDRLVQMRAADAVEKITRFRPDLLRPCKATLINRVAKNEHREVRWHVAQLIPRLELNSAEQRKAVTILTDYLKDESRIVKTFSMQALADIATKDERLRSSVVKRLEELMKDGSPAMRSRGTKLLAKLKRHESSI